MTFDDFFRQATKTKSEPHGRDAYPYQSRFAVDDELPELLNVPTGVGKTATAILGWLYRRRFHTDKHIQRTTPRRLIFCLPMRVLVEQTRDFARDWLEQLGMLTEKPGDEHPVDGWAAQHGDTGRRLAVSVLMGGSERDELRDWTLWPERDAILIGTQDMLLSRALNRGYASGRARWPMEFALLNNDCLWVFDEVQLMGSGLATTAQLAAFREGGKQSVGLGTIGNCRSLWMSATAETKWLDTIDHDVSRLTRLELSSEEREPAADVDPDSPQGQLGRRLRATKTLRRADNVTDLQPDDVARVVIDGHRRHSQETGQPILTVVVVNVVERARGLHQAIRNANAPAKKRVKGVETTATSTGPELLLLHSRFRSKDRRRVIDKLILAQKVIDAVSAGQSVPVSKDSELAEFADRVAQHGVVVVSTQVIEAGVDISARFLITELAPWASLVQRFGRCNRRGEHTAAEVIWLDFEAGDEKAARPYELEELRTARRHLLALQGRSVGPNELDRYREAEGIELPYRPLHVLRRKDLIELFDTTPDLAGNDLDVSRYIREADDHDVQIFWRLVPERGKPDKETSPPRREELCPVPVHQFIDFAKLHKDRIWRWDFLESQWVKARPDVIFPGQMFLVASDVGGYVPSDGWSKDSKAAVQPVDDPVGNRTTADGYDGEPLSEQKKWQTIAEHTDDVCAALEVILTALRPAGFKLPEATLRLAARWHDRGKAHDVFQAAVPTDAVHQPGEWAKAPGRFRRYRRKHFRHELASALAVLQTSHELIPREMLDLLAYLVASHHGKVRLSIRSLPDETVPADTNGILQLDRLFARGVWDNDQLPAVNLGGEVGMAPEVKLSLEPMKLGLSPDGQPSWIDRMLQLRDRADLGLFRLAFWEALLRAADCRASAAANAPQLDAVSDNAREDAQ